MYFHGQNDYGFAAKSKRRNLIFKFTFLIHNYENKQKNKKQTKTNNFHYMQMHINIFRAVKKAHICEFFYDDARIVAR